MKLISGPIKNALNILEKKLSKDYKNWKWGYLNIGKIKHLIFEKIPILSFFYSIIFSD